MKIFIISKSFWNTYNFRYELLLKLTNDKHKVSVIAKKNNFYRKINKLKINTKFFDSNNRFISPLRDLIYLFRLINIVKKEKPQLILNFNLKPIIFGNIDLTA